jgi:hypothetical protein
MELGQIEGQTMTILCLIQQGWKRQFTFCEFHTELSLVHQVSAVPCQNMVGFQTSAEW